MNQIMDVLEIAKCLPHRYPFLLIDRVVEMELGVSIKAIKNVSINEPFFQGHFPNYPVMPGVLIMEALAQAAGVLSYKSLKVPPSEDSLYFFAGIDNARFKRQVVPGDQLTLCVQITANKRGIWKYKAQAFVGDELAAEADLMCAQRDVKR
ncbi:3-hydroxyacyl-ACP dehydratase FabZ [Iodobacter fluviatilis]|jgi:3-hydroxyacyl-[acyl-carrier-protein] dehydratase|nr:3-hydroxyacyl-ACP dehydratase FabZ [Iodobacter fluviatilis]